ncbi:hypothetical protein DFJ77DRAFT_145222 [Powellomyces hirtus]|nr:hypothetical protein DFJ77DRAFT_145222 [Powellomyces hirtus]
MALGARYRWNTRALTLIVFAALFVGTAVTAFYKWTKTPISMPTFRYSPESRFPDFRLSTFKPTKHTPKPDTLLSCSETIQKAVANDKDLDQNVKDLITLLASSFDQRSQAAYYARLERLPLSIEDAHGLQSRIDAYQLCGNTTAVATGQPLPKVGICSVQHSSGPHIQEWLSHHVLLGISKFFIYDNSDPASAASRHFRRAVKPFVELGYVDVIDWHFTEGDTYRQNEALNDCLRINRPHFDWLAIFDTDEFAVIHEPHNSCLPELLANRQDLGALILQWRQMTPRGVPLHNFGKTHLEQYHYETIPQNSHIKPILNTQHATWIRSPHVCDYHEGWPAKTAGGVAVHGTTTEILDPSAYKHMELRHYWARDWAFGFMDKIIEGKTRHQDPLHKFLFGFTSTID